MHILSIYFRLLRLNIEEYVKIQVKIFQSQAHVGQAGSIGPIWTYDDSVEKPAGTKDMGGWTASVYTEEQQNRLGVDESGVPVTDSKSSDKNLIGSSEGSIGPEWTWNSKVEPPAGVKDMGTWKKFVYTEEQQARLFVDEDGLPLSITDFLLNRWDTGNAEPSLLGEDGHGIGPDFTLPDSSEEKHLLGENGHGIGPDSTLPKPTEVKHLLGENGHGIGPDFTLPKATEEKHLLGENGHGIGPDFTLPKATEEKHLLGENGHGIGPDFTLPKATEEKHLLGENGHGIGPDFTLPKATEEKHLLGENGHGIGPDFTLPKTIVGANGHGIRKPGLILGSKGSVAPKWTYDGSMEKPMGEKDMGSYTMKVYTPEQQKRLGVNELGRSMIKKIRIADI